MVTALGISKRSRGLGYAATNVKPEELTVNRTPNPINALEGKVAGVNITSLGYWVRVGLLKFASEDNLQSRLATIVLLLLSTVFL